MRRNLKFTMSALVWAIMLITAYAASAQTGATNKQQAAAAKSVATQAAAGFDPQVFGTGTVGQLPKWTLIKGANSFLGDSIISEQQGNIGISTTSPSSKLTVQGMIETTLGGYKFPDGTVQTSAAANGLPSVLHDSTLAGDGTKASPLSIQVPLTLSGSVNQPILKINNSGGQGLFASSDTTVGVEGRSFKSTGVFGISLAAEGVGVFGSGNKSGVSGGSGSGTGTEGISFSGVGVLGSSSHSDGVLGQSGTGIGVHGISKVIDAPAVFGENANNGTGVLGSSNLGAGVHGISNLNFGLLGESSSGTGVVGIASDGDGVFGHGGQGLSAGNFQGDVRVNGDLNVTGQKSFKIDHPLDPENKYLVHAAIESSEVKDLYDGVVTLDQNGEAVVKLPEWFQALNKDFRYSLTSIGTPGAGLYIAEEVADNHFRIAGGAPLAKVSWQVTGIRNDAYMKKHPMQVEVDKPEKERGHYLQPELYDQPEEKSIESVRNPDLVQRLKEMKEKGKQQ
ncbi:MAG TPA: hypothetical protein VNS63_07405 [Blastocatellia bacterium]|nr:hypothetical protein [Blastocatellia bacterium]